MEKVDVLQKYLKGNKIEKFSPPPKENRKWSLFFKDFFLLSSTPCFYSIPCE